MFREAEPIDHRGLYGGEEFLIVLPECNPNQVERCAERVKLKIAGELVRFNAAAIPVTASLDVAVTNLLPGNVKHALESAASALYRVGSIVYIDIKTGHEGVKVLAVKYICEANAPLLRLSLHSQRISTETLFCAMLEA